MALVALPRLQYTSLHIEETNESRAIRGKSL